MAGISRLLSESPVSYVIMQIGVIFLAIGIGASIAHKRVVSETRIILRDILKGRLTPDIKNEFIWKLFDLDKEDK